MNPTVSPIPTTISNDPIKFQESKAKKENSVVELVFDFSINPCPNTINIFGVPDHVAIDNFLEPQTNEDREQTKQKMGINRHK